MAVSANGGFPVKENFSADETNFELKEVSKKNLVLLVYQHSNLWKVDSQEFSQKALIEQSWRQIAAELGLNVESWEQVKRKWKTVKDEYVKWHRYCNNPPPDGVKVRKRAYKPLFQSMEFLDPYLRHRNTGATKSPMSKSAKYPDSPNGHATENLEKSVSQVDTVAAGPDLCTALGSRKFPTKVTEVGNSRSFFENKDGSVLIKDEPLAKKQAKDSGDSLYASLKGGHSSVTKKGNSDGVRHFLEDISVTLQRLPDNKLQYAKMKIQLFLYNLQYGTSDFTETQDALE